MTTRSRTRLPTLTDEISGLASHLYTETLLREAFVDLDLVTLREYEADLAEGSGHCGHSALIGLIARRR